MTNALPNTASSQDQWEFDRAQNLIDQIKGDIAAGKYSNPTDLATAQKREREQIAVQNYLVKKNVASEEVNAAVDVVDAAWVAANPRPPAPPEPEEPK